MALSQRAAAGRSTAKWRRPARATAANVGGRVALDRWHGTCGRPPATGAVCLSGWPGSRGAPVAVSSTHLGAARQPQAAEVTGRQRRESAAPRAWVAEDTGADPQAHPKCARRGRAGPSREEAPAGWRFGISCGERGALSLNRRRWWANGGRAPSLFFCRARRPTGPSVSTRSLEALGGRREDDRDATSHFQTRRGLPQPRTQGGAQA